MEILVVAIIIGILMALVFPAVASWKKAADSAACVSNLRQIGIALATYAAEHDGTLFSGSCLNEAGTYNWYQFLDEEYMGGTPTNRYSDNRPSWQECPSKIFPSDPSYNKNNKWWLVGYGWNWSSGTFTRGPDGQWMADGGLGYLPGLPGYNPRLSEITRPAHTIVVGDSMDIESKPEFYRNMFLYPPVAAYSYVRFRASRHGGMGNYLMVDGHVEALPSTMDGSYFKKAQ
jgi:prepilin-type processing-associated H-X9-DG protein